MLNVRVEGLGELRATLTQWQRDQVPFATHKTLNIVAERLMGMQYQKFKHKLHKPTNTTMSSLYVKYSKDKRDLKCEVGLKDIPIGKSGVGGNNPLSMNQILGHLFSGGARHHKVSEYTLRKFGFLEPGEFLVPHRSGARFDTHGNMSHGQMQQIYSQLGIRRSSGYDNAPTGSDRSRNNVKKAGVMFWSYGPGTDVSRKPTKILNFETGRYERGIKQHLPKGLYIRDGRGIKMVLSVAQQAPSAKKMFDMRNLAQEAVDLHFWKEFQNQFDLAMKTAGKLSPGATRAQRKADFIARGMGSKGWR